MIKTPHTSTSKPLLRPTDMRERTYPYRVLSKYRMTGINKYTEYVYIEMIIKI